MQPVPNDILTQFDALMVKKAVPFSVRPDYRKWLRFYLDFRSKYPLPYSKSEHVRLFIEKLQQKNQTPAQQKQAAYALSLFFIMQKAGTTETATTPYAPFSKPEVGALSREYSISSQYLATLEGLPLQVSEAATTPSSPVNHNSPSPEWDTLIDTLAAEIKTRHYSRKTLKKSISFLSFR